MTKLFDSVEAFRESGFLFRITDNGGDSVDRFTVMTCDGDYFASSATPYHPQGFFQSGERIDVQGVDDRIESGRERDLRWIDLPADVQSAVIGRLNDGFSYWLDQENAACTRAEVEGEFSGGYDEIGRGIYCTIWGFRIADENSQGDARQDPGPFATYKDAVLHTLPQDYDLSGPEYHTPVDLWADEGGAAELWEAVELESAS